MRWWMNWMSWIFDRSGCASGFKWTRLRSGMAVEDCPTEQLRTTVLLWCRYLLGYGGRAVFKCRACKVEITLLNAEVVQFLSV